MRRILTLLACLLVAAACSRARQYELRGQVLSVDRARQVITIKHEDVKGFMPAMTMPFKVREASLLDGRSAGELVTATLVVEEADAYLSSITKTGEAPLTEAPPPTNVHDVLKEGDAAPDVELSDQDGKTRRLSEWRGQTLVLTFIYTRCPLPNFCPLMDRNFAAAQRAILGDQRLASRVHLLSVSFDPDFDTPAVLASHARGVGARPATWTFATGTRHAIDEFAGRFGVSVIRDAVETQDIVHNLRTAVIGGDGRIVALFSGNEWTTDELMQSVRGASEGRP